MKETSIGNEADGRTSAGARYILLSEISGVGLLQQLHAQIRPQPCVNLAVSRIDGDHLSGAVLQHAIGKSAGGRSNIHASSAGEIDLPVAQRCFQLQAAASNVFEVLAEQSDGSVKIDAGAGFLNFLFVDQHATGKHHCLCALARRHEAALHQKLVDAHFHSSNCMWRNLTWPTLRRERRPRHWGELQKTFAQIAGRR